MQNKYDKFAGIYKKDKNREQIYICKRPVGSISGIFYTIFGFAFSGILRCFVGYISDDHSLFRIHL